jgi:hypothetical protein
MRYRMQLAAARPPPCPTCTCSTTGGMGCPSRSSLHTCATASRRRWPCSACRACSSACARPAGGRAPGGSTRAHGRRCARRRPARGPARPPPAPGQAGGGGERAAGLAGWASRWRRAGPWGGRSHAPPGGGGMRLTGAAARRLLDWRARRAGRRGHARWQHMPGFARLRPAGRRWTPGRLPSLLLTAETAGANLAGCRPAGASRAAVTMRVPCQPQARRSQGIRPHRAESLAVVLRRRQDGARHERRQAVQHACGRAGLLRDGNEARGGSDVQCLVVLSAEHAGQAQAQQGSASYRGHQVDEPGAVQSGRVHLRWAGRGELRCAVWPRLPTRGGISLQDMGGQPKSRPCRRSRGSWGEGCARRLTAARGTARRACQGPRVHLTGALSRRSGLLCTKAAAAGRSAGEGFFSPASRPAEASAPCGHAPHSMQAARP